MPLVTIAWVLDWRRYEDEKLSRVRLCVDFCRGQPWTSVRACVRSLGIPRCAKLDPSLALRALAGARRVPGDSGKLLASDSRSRCLKLGPNFGGAAGPPVGVVVAGLAVIAGLAAAYSLYQEWLNEAPLLPILTEEARQYLPSLDLSPIWTNCDSMRQAETVEAPMRQATGVALLEGARQPRTKEVRRRPKVCIVAATFVDPALSRVGIARAKL